ncbi:MAG: thiamine pyrophosphate-binding protein [Planctomycetaceae bacterium]
MDDGPPLKYAALVGDWLVEAGYTHCFLVAGGGCMHLIDAFRTRFACIPVVHEVTAGIAVEHFNECAAGNRAFALVTTGPGLTNIVTAVAGCWAQRRDLLVIAGQVKSTDLLEPPLRQRGIQEVDGTAIVRPVAVRAERLTRPVGREAFLEMVHAGRSPHPGPVVIEVCLDVQGAPVRPDALPAAAVAGAPTAAADAPMVAAAAAEIVRRLAGAARPLVLLGGLVSRRAAAETLPALHRLGVPVMTTTSAIDRVPSAAPIAAGRPGTWGGQRSANLLVAQADLLVALGARLDLQQTGFDWRGFAPAARIVQVYPCAAEIAKGHPPIDAGFALEPDAVLRAVTAAARFPDRGHWGAYVRRVRELVPVLEPANETGIPGGSAFRFLHELSAATSADDILALCSSGGTFTGALQVTEVKPGQIATTSPALASMGWGLGSAIGAAFARPGRRVVLSEGDGGFSQNLQELALVRRHDLPITMFILANRGYASIRATQRKFFGGAHVGCDEATGLGFPDWEALFAAYRIPAARLPPGERSRERLAALLERPGPAAWIVDVDPEQPNFPAVTSRINADGSMDSNPLWLQQPPLPPAIAAEVGRYLPGAG